MDDYVGNWIQSNTNGKTAMLLCNRSEYTLTCELKNTVHTFAINRQNRRKLTNQANEKIKGIYQNNGTIIWHKGPKFFATWVKPGT